MDIFTDKINNSPPPDYIIPLFWQHGEDEETLREEIKVMHESGIGGFIVESRPHPDFLGEKWWNDLDIIIDEAKKREMKVWIFDDSLFPSGYCAGKIKDKHPEFLKLYLKEQHIDAVGPMKGSSFLIEAWLSDEELVKVLAAKRTDYQNEFDANSLIDLTEKIVNGILYWDLPEGPYRIFIFSATREGGEIYTKDYINPLDENAVKKYIETVHVAHYKRYSEEFGRTIAGFFTDEPRLGNASSYNASVGNYSMVLPFSKELIELINNEWDRDFSKYFPCLWYDGGDITAEVRYKFMDVVSRQFGKNYSTQIGNWCRKHNVKFIGHVVEENGAHARLGFGNGHFFRSVSGQDASGVDVVYNIWPEFDTGTFNTPFYDCDAQFSYWGIIKLATSAAHIDPKKNGITVCEIFGAYGWQEGLKLMKWLTDHVCVRGVNLLIPHAFSPKYPDNDCPPHFYAQGHNPQWKYFNIWSAYANRVCHILTGGNHVANVAVMYHAEAEWAGKYEPFEKVVKSLMQNQIDCDVVPVDIFADKAVLSINNGSFSINNENYMVLIIPYSEYLTSDLINTLLLIANNNIPIIFMHDFPSYTVNLKSEKSQLDLLKQHKFISVSKHNSIISDLRKLDISDILLSEFHPSLRYYHYNIKDEDIYFLTNESKYKTVKTTINFNNSRNVFLYDAMSDKCYLAEAKKERNSTNLQISLDPYESVFVIFSDKANIDFVDKKIDREQYIKEVILDEHWVISTATAEKYPEFSPVENLFSLCNISSAHVLPDFSGTILYEKTFTINFETGNFRILLELGDVFETAHVKINGHNAGVRIAPPYRFDITDFLKEDSNHLQVYITNTLSKQSPSKLYDRYMPQEPSGLIGPVKLRFYHA